MSNDGRLTYENLSEKFILQAFDYQKQFSHLYAHRLAEMTALLTPLVEERWGAEYPIKKLCDLREEQDMACVIIGTIYKHQVNKPSILREISEENQLAPQPARKHYADPEDKLILEDELQRVRLQGNVDIRILATGVVCAALGTIEEDGRFIVDELLFYESGPQRPLPKNETDLAKWVVLVSGLDGMHTEINCVEALNMLQFWLGGSLPSNNRRELVRLIVAGDSLRTAAGLEAASGSENSPADVAAAMCTLDSWFKSWSSCISVDVMPGAHDPANFMLPQQPFHRCMLPQASRNTNFQSVSNPYACSIGGVNIVGTSGQSVQDLLRTTMFDEPLEALRSTLVWGHLAPTAPDTLACYPYTKNDPLILHECPHVYFAGNCKGFATDLHKSSDGKQTRLVCVPSFSTTQSAVIVNLHTLECKQICFSSKIE